MTEKREIIPPVAKVKSSGMSSFLFIVPVTPSELMTPLRKELYNLFLSSLNNQTYPNWEAYLLGEEDKTEGRIRFIKTEAVSKADKLLWAVEYLRNLENKPDYVIRMDDDDLISPSILSRVAPLDFDCYADKYHTFYSLTTGKVSSNKRSWLANTVIHKCEHIFAEIRKPGDVLVENDNYTLLGVDHDIYWLKYYEDKKMLWSDRDRPIYLRILSPTSITSKLPDNYGKGVNKVTDQETDFKRYLKGYGPWVHKSLPDFSRYYKGLKHIWEKHSSGSLITDGFVSGVNDYLKYYLRITVGSGKELGSGLVRNTRYIACTRCVLDTNDDPFISFHRNGVCNYCIEYDELMQSLPAKEEKKAEFQKVIDQIKSTGKDNKYNCLLGVSGGTDSSYLAYLCKENGLRPLVVHFDNGWNSELAVNNIHRILDRLNFDMITYVVNWEEFKDLQIAYLKASVVDIEAITDHAITATMDRLARKHKIKYLLSGNNFVTEAIMPRGWTWYKLDWANIKSIHKKFGTVKLKTFPRITFMWKIFNLYFFKNKTAQLLNSVEYNQAEVKKILERELGWIDYGGKHHESVFTKFYQLYILPVKFKIDKRKAHLSNLICSGQITREQAMEELKKNIYDPAVLRTEKEYVLKKLGLSETEFDEIMQAPPKRHDDYFSEKKYFAIYFLFLRLMRPFYKPFKKIG